jgi:hypothetical protein
VASRANSASVACELRGPRLRRSAGRRGASCTFGVGRDGLRAPLQCARPAFWLWIPLPFSPVLGLRRSLRAPRRRRPSSFAYDVTLHFLFFSVGRGVSLLLYPFVLFYSTPPSSSLTPLIFST